MKKVLFISIMFIFFACSNQNDKITGSWEFVTIEAGANIDPMAVFPLVFMSEDLKGTTFTFKEDLSLELKKEEEIKELNYKLLEGNRLIINGDTSVYSIKIDTLYLNSNDAVSKLIKIE